MEFVVHYHDLQMIIKIPLLDHPNHLAIDLEGEIDGLEFLLVLTVGHRKGDPYQSASKLSVLIIPNLLFPVLMDGHWHKELHRKVSEVIDPKTGQKYKSC